MLIDNEYKYTEWSGTYNIYLEVWFRYNLKLNILLFFY